ncbi:hypothetical protein [Myroides sp. WP-1]|uniref:hypothetical protein n=1 Tax=Myroides sp. WP-1 TaxID=2759944 RepID=UPI0015FE115D|nr:hypothetical protein [Myroides sp. WP-1]MBB1140063.1 hypothetical protein [Myroides sp. WP-1]
MRNSLYNKKQLFTWIAFVWVVSTALSGFAQVKKPFSKRMEFNVQGEFTMIGNTNLTLSSYSASTGNGNEKMEYVDVDGDWNTINSSSATLVLPNTNVTCQKIVYAGLYWSGRAHENESPMSFTVARMEEVTQYDQNISKGNSFSTGGFKFTNVQSEGSSRDKYPKYTLSNEAFLFATQYDFRLTNNATNPVQYRKNFITNGEYQTLASTYDSNTGIVTLTTPFEIKVGSSTVYITKFKRDTNTNGNTQSYTNAAVIYYNTVTTREVDPNRNPPLNKRKVKLKMAGDSYREIEAAATDIYYPNNQDGNMYSAYADVTDYVQTKGAGEYFVADIALNADNGGSTGFYGGWGMIVVYETPGTTRRSISVFDGHAYVPGSTTTNYELPISGFRAAQTGNARVTLGLMAGEGDIDIKGDYFDIRNADDTEWRRINRVTGNTTLATSNDLSVNFFDSSINTGGNPRNPSLTNNTGMDLARFDLSNNNNNLIGKEQTSTRFRYGSNQDTYIIYNMVFAVDAYEPEVIGFNRPITHNGFLPTHNGTIQPGQDLAFQLDLYNKGSDAVTGTKVEIPIPFNLHYVAAQPTPNMAVGGTVSWVPPTGGTNDPVVTSGGTIVWTVGELPLDLTQRELLGQLKYYLKASENCVLLATNSCGLNLEINGNILGKGKNSQVDLNAPFVREYSTDLCAQPNLEPFKMTLVASTMFLSSCTPPVDNGVLYFKEVCSASTSNQLDRAEVVNAYPQGTKFFNVPPSSYESTTGLVTGNFALNSDGTPKNYYAVVPGMEIGCYAKLAISKDVITTVPTATDVSFCLNDTVVPNVERSATGVTNNYVLFYFDADGNPLTTIPNPTTVGTHRYFVAEGKGACYGNKVPFDITIVDSPTVNTSLADVSICENSDSQLVSVVANGSTYTWEYSTTGDPTWKTLTNTTFSQVVFVTDKTLKVEHATKSINGLKVRLIVKRGNCVSESNTFTIHVGDCPGVSNPMLLNPAIF